MAVSQLGRLQPLDLREAWQSEAGDFTPWLAQEENITLLAETLDMELEVEAQEKNVGPFRADILCKDLATDAWVLIENQLERTDHTHLGQLLTYAAGLKAVTIVWVAHNFTEEHRATLDWLNEITDDRFNFFGLEIELWRIGGSPPAPKFNVVSKPNDWSRSVTGATRTIEAGDLSETRQLQLEYWTAFMEELRRRKSSVRPRKPFPQHWMLYAVGRSRFSLITVAAIQRPRVGCGLVLKGPDRLAHFHLLLEQKQQIEEELGFPVQWRELPGKKESRIDISRHDFNPKDREQWPLQIEWLANTLESFYHVFSPRVKQLDATDYEPDETD